MASLRDREFDLRESIKNLEKDVQGHKKEIRERDETIADKEKRIFDLKKKNQELEKFKFVLDYKIKELKRQIEPRESEIADLRRQVEEMDLELEQYHKSNAALDLMIGELRLKLDGMSKELSQQKSLIKAGESYTRKFRRDLAMCAAGVEDQNDLKAGVKELYQRYVLDEDKRKSSEEESSAGFDLQAEYARQREHLERNVAQLKRKVLKDEKMYKTDKKRMASEGKLLTETMNKLKAVHAEDLQRREDLALKSEAQASDPRLAEIVAGLGERAQMLEELMGEAGLLHPPPLPQ
jgi:chromosome segregation ATPase